MDREESFTVPDNSNTYFVDDASNVNDEYTGAAVGSNRNTGKKAVSAKPHPVNLLRAYDIPAGSIVSIDTGIYPMFDALRISGSQDWAWDLKKLLPTWPRPIREIRRIGLD